MHVSDARFSRRTSANGSRCSTALPGPGPLRGFAAGTAAAGSSCWIRRTSRRHVTRWSGILRWSRGCNRDSSIRSLSSSNDPESGLPSPGHFSSDRQTCCARTRMANGRERLNAVRLVANNLRFTIESRPATHQPCARGPWVQRPFCVHGPAVSIEGYARPCRSRHFMGVEWHVESRIVESTGAQQPQR